MSYRQSGSLNEVKCCFVYCSCYVDSSPLGAVGETKVFVQSVRTETTVSCSHLSFFRALCNENWAFENLVSSMLLIC